MYIRDWLNKIWHIYSMECEIDIKKWCSTRICNGIERYTLKTAGFKEVSLVGYNFINIYIEYKRKNIHQIINGVFPCHKR